MNRGDRNHRPSVELVCVNRVLNQSENQVAVDIGGDSQSKVYAQFQIDRLNQLCNCQRSRVVCLED